MDNSYLILGILVLFSGIIGYGYTASELEECDSLVGEIGQSLDEETRQQCDRIGLANSVSIGAAAVGAILSIAGLVSMANSSGQNN